jgi:hypothetical protein
VLTKRCNNDRKSFCQFLDRSLTFLTSAGSMQSQKFIMLKWVSEKFCQRKVGAKFSAPVQTSPKAHAVSCTMLRRVSFPGVKRPRRGISYPPSSSAEVKQRVEIPLLPIWGFKVFYGTACIKHVQTNKDTVGPCYFPMLFTCINLLKPSSNFIHDQV